MILSVWFGYNNLPPMIWCQLHYRHRRPLVGNYSDDDYEVDGDDMTSEKEDDKERRQLKLILKLPTAACRRVSLSSNGEDGDSVMVKPLKKRRIEGCSDDSDRSDHPREERKRGTEIFQPVDPEELPDYHDAIEHQPLLCREGRLGSPNVTLGPTVREGEDSSQFPYMKGMRKNS